MQTQPFVPLTGGGEGGWNTHQQKKGGGGDPGACPQKILVKLSDLCLF